MVIVAIVTGVLSFGNYVWQANVDMSTGMRVLSTAIQLVLTAVTIWAAVSYGGQRTRPSYNMAGYRIFTLGFAVILLSLLGNLSVLVVFILHLFGLLKWW